MDGIAVSRVIASEVDGRLRGFLTECGRTLHFQTSLTWFSRNDLSRSKNLPQDPYPNLRRANQNLLAFRIPASSADVFSTFSSITDIALVCTESGLNKHQNASKSPPSASAPCSPNPIPCVHPSTKSLFRSSSAFTLTLAPKPSFHSPSRIHPRSDTLRITLQKPNSPATPDFRRHKELRRRSTAKNP